MSPIAAKLTAIDKRGVGTKGIVQFNPKYRGSFNSPAFEEIKPHSSSLTDGRLELVCYQNPDLKHRPFF
jgi:hypothetical protein